MVSPARSRTFALALASALAGSACKPKIEGRPSLIDGDRILAVASTPAEAKAGASVVYSALYVGMDGPLDAAGLDFALCTQPKPLAVTGPIALECLTKSSKSLAPIGLDGDQHAKITLPDAACREFGPSPPMQKMGQPALRPADPDTTGGYYSPVRVSATVEGKPEFTAGVTRLDCGLPGASLEQKTAYTSQYWRNENPAIASLELRAGSRDDSVPEADTDPAPQVKPGQRIVLRASWNECPKNPECGDGICGGPGKDCKDDCGADAQGCTGAEPYMMLDQQQHELIHRREAIRISWFATDGRFEHERTGRGEDEAEHSFSDNGWTAPTKTGELWLWVVIRDDRGGVGWSAYKLDVER